MPCIAYARAHAATSKDEDFCFARLLETGHAGFGVFDGHGGQQAAKLCQERLLADLLLAGPPYTAEPIIEGHWALDEKIGQQGELSGSTTSILLVESCPQELRCLLAWCGDSTGIRVDMRSTSPRPTPDFVTANHSTANELEVRRMQLEWRVRAILTEDDEVDEVFSAESPEPAAEIVERVLGGIEGAMEELRCLGTSDEHRTAVLVRTLSRAKRMEVQDDAHRRDPTFIGKRCGRDGAPMVVRCRRFSDVGMEAGVCDNVSGDAFQQDPSAPSPVLTAALRDELAGRSSPALKVVGTRRHTYENSTVVTRSIGDWDCSRALIPHPEIAEFVVRTDEHARVVLASDGLWDFVPVDEAAAIVRRAKTVQSGADTLLSLAKRRSCSKFNFLKDDTTVLLIDLNPSDVAPVPVEGASGTAACCTVS